MDPQKIVLGFWILFFSGLVGLLVKFVLDQMNNDAEITWREYVQGLIVIGLIFSVVGVNIGWSVARNSLKSFNEFWGGWEKAAYTQPITCTKDGACVYEYSCDPYTVPVQHCESKSDGNGGTTTECHTDYETRYHDCPVYTTETSYYVDDTLGQTHEFASHCVDANPVRWGVGTSDFEQNHSAPNACVGVPADWAAVDYRVNVIHQPGPAFKKNVYDNLVIAADQELYKEYAGYVRDYVDAGVMPMVASPDKIHNHYLAEPIYFVGWQPADPNKWIEYIRYMDGGFGDELHGTVHVVIVQSPMADMNPDRYITSMKAYWQDPEYCGDNCFAKNGVLVVIGTKNGVTADWTRCETGMPVGNTDLINVCMSPNPEINPLAGVLLTPEATLGLVVPEPYVREDGKNKVRVLHPNPGGVESLIWGLKNPLTVFVRISMSGKDADDVGTGFTYLDELIRPNKDQQRNIVIVCTLLSMVVWVVFGYVGERVRSYRRSSRRF